MCRRWVTSPSVSAFDANPEQKKAIQQVIDSLNAILEKTTTVRINLASDADEKAALEVHFLPSKDIPGFARAHSMQVHSNESFDYNWIFPNKRDEIQKAYVLMSDSLSDTPLIHYTLFGIASSLGIMIRTKR